MGSSISTSQLPNKPLPAKNMRHYVDQKAKERKEEIDKEFKRCHPNWENEQNKELQKAQQAEIERIKKCIDIMKNFNNDFMIHTFNERYDSGGYHHIGMPEKYESCLPEIQALQYSVTWQREDDIVYPGRMILMVKFSDKEHE